MYQRDFLEKLIEKFGVFVAKFFSGESNFSDQEVFESIEKQAESFLGNENLHLINQNLELPEALILKKVSKNGIQVLEMAAKILYEKSKLFENQTALVSSNKCKEKAVLIMDLVSLIDKTYDLKRQNFILELRKKSI